MHQWMVLGFVFLSEQFVVGQESVGPQVITAACINAQTRLFESEACGNAVAETALVVSGLTTMVDDQTLSLICTRNCRNLAVTVLDQCVDEVSGLCITSMLLKIPIHIIKFIQ